MIKPLGVTPIDIALAAVAPLVVELLKSVPDDDFAAGLDMALCWLAEIRGPEGRDFKIIEGHPEIWIHADGHAGWDTPKLPSFESVISGL